MSQITNRIQTLFTTLYHALPQTKTGRTAVACAVAFAALAAWVAFNGTPRCLTRRMTPVEKEKSLPVREAQSFISCTYADNDNGVIDFAHADTAGFGFVADVTGHNKPHRKPGVQTFFQEFSRKFAEQLNGKETTQNESKKFLFETLFGLSESLENMRQASTFSLALLTVREGKKFATVIHVGDSSLFLVQGAEVRGLTPKGKRDTNDSELGSLSLHSPIFYMTIEVQSGDVIYGVTDGITDFLQDDALNRLLTEQFSFEKLKTAVKENIADPSKADDIGLFRLVVP